MWALCGGGVKSHRFDSSSPSYSDIGSAFGSCLPSGQNADSKGLRRICGITEVEFDLRTVDRGTEIKIDRGWRIGGAACARETDFNLRTVHIQIQRGAIRAAEVDDDFGSGSGAACSGSRARGRG